LDAVALDHMGSCCNCIYVSIEERVLKEYREKLQRKYKDQEVE